MIAVIEIENGSCDPDHVPFRGGLSFYRLGFDIFYLFVKCDDSGLNRSRDIIGAPKFKVGYMTLTTPLLRVICCEYAAQDLT